MAASILKHPHGSLCLVILRISDAFIRLCTLSLSFEFRYCKLNVID